LVLFQFKYFFFNFLKDSERDADKEILLSKAREMPERTLSGGSATSWCELGK